MNLRELLPLFNQVKDLGISCDGSKVTMTITKVMRRRKDRNFRLKNFKLFLNYFLLKAKQYTRFEFVFMEHGKGQSWLF